MLSAVITFFHFFFVSQFSSNHSSAHFFIIWYTSIDHVTIPCWVFLHKSDLQSSLKIKSACQEIISLYLWKAAGSSCCWSWWCWCSPSLMWWWWWWEHSMAAAISLPLLVPPYLPYLHVEQNLFKCGIRQGLPLMKGYERKTAGKHANCTLLCCKRAADHRYGGLLEK